jgi:hypothetical protein
MGTEKGIRGGQLSRLGASSLSVLSRSASSGSAPEFAAQMATRLFGFFPRSEANDPDTFIAGAAAVLMRYPEAVVRAVCDPARGLPSTNKFFSLAELREVCEREMVWHDAVVKREARRAETQRVLGDVRAAPQGSPEHGRVLRSFKDLGEAMAARSPKDARPKPFTLPVDAPRPLYADEPPVVTAAMREYLGRWIEPLRRDDDDASVF